MEVEPIREEFFYLKKSWTKNIFIITSYKLSKKSHKTQLSNIHKIKNKQMKVLYPIRGQIG